MHARSFSYLGDSNVQIADMGGDFSLSDADSAALGLVDPGDGLVLVLLTARGDPASVTANLLGPLVVNVRTGRGRQLVLAESGYSAQHPIVG
jgi:flagellar assembly factor FliW